MDNFYITIGRQFGSGGRESAEKLAKLLNVKCYDKEILEIASEESGYSKELFENADEKRSYVFSEGMLGARGTVIGNFYSMADTLSSDNLFKHKMDAIKSIADKGSCIIVGRCADYILRDYKRVLKVFITCHDMNTRIERVKLRHPEIAEKNIESFIEKTDKKRASYYNFYTDQEWGEAKNYDLTVDTGKFGVDGAAEIIAQAVKHMIK